MPEVVSRMWSCVLRAAAITLVCATEARAQSLPQLRDGFTASAGIGAGVAGVQCPACANGAGVSVYARFGGALRPDLILAGEVSNWRRAGTITAASQSEVREMLATIDMVAQWYPRVERGFFVAPGIGLGILETRISDRTTGVFYRSGVSGGYQLGVGYDYRAKKYFSWTPYATFFGVAPGHMSGITGSVHGNALQIGLGMTKH
ncbi:MAG: hypothetical protein DMD35_13700 [Gemmatimonadetes bacterium]|nr:MAG: hypothetical protein DMD35_13700 [Gemmatimonadota bacterium]